jgi:hypothetical protein
MERQFRIFHGGLSRYGSIKSNKLSMDPDSFWRGK